MRCLDASLALPGPTPPAPAGLQAFAAQRPALPWRWNPAPLSATRSPRAAGTALASGTREQAMIKLMKARSAAECERLEQLPNIGPAMAGDLRLLGIAHPRQLQGQDPLVLYRRLEASTGRRQDPCVLDTFIAACEFMSGGVPRPWWAYTTRRKQHYGVL